MAFASLERGNAVVCRTNGAPFSAIGWLVSSSVFAFDLCPIGLSNGGIWNPTGVEQELNKCPRQD
jgi:hypothetical protein